MRRQEASASSEYVKVKAKKKKKTSSKFIRIMTNSWQDTKSFKCFNDNEIQH